MLLDVFGPPGAVGLIDAGCGTGRQAIALAMRGYRVVGVDAGEEMLELARRLAGEASQTIEFVCTPYEGMHAAIGGGFDGICCLGNALAAAGSGDAVAEALREFALCLRPGGRLFLQILNFAPMRHELPCLRGPRVALVDGREYVSVRHFCFESDHVDVTNVTLWHDGSWRQWARTGRLYPAELGELRTWCQSAGLKIDAEWGGYDRRPLDLEKSSDLLIVATRT